MPGQPADPREFSVRKKFVTALAVGTIALSGLALSGPALAAVGATSVADKAAAPVDRIKEALSGLVTDKTLTQAQADKVASTLSEAGVGRGGGRGGPGGHGADLSAAATALGISEADLRTALESGKTLAQVAKDKNVSVDTLVAALVKAETARIEQDVTDGRLTQAQADERLADLTKRVTDRVNSTRPAGPGPGRGGDKGGDRPTPSASPSASS
jgi:hypothetical protein